MANRCRSFAEDYGISTDRISRLLRNSEALTEIEAARILAIFKLKYPQLQILIKQRKEDLKAII